MGKVKSTVKQITVSVQRWETTDGKVFTKECDALIHQGKIDGNIKDCPDCHGTGKFDNFGDGREFTTCSRCSGRGHLVKSAMWS